MQQNPSDDVSCINDVERGGNTAAYIMEIVGNKAKGRISKQVFQENSIPNFSKNEHFLLPDTHTYVQNYRRNNAWS